ncbi:CPBP family glutamic-type intramembrane protease [Peribacillus glennii]|nr:CPBP family glutamic-type intramembrane protease [Peribacillus glennii]
MKTKRKNIKLVLFMTIFAFFSCIFALPYTTIALKVPAGLEMSQTRLLVLMMINLTVGSFLASLIGLYLGPKVGLKADILRNWVYKDTGAKFNRQTVLFSAVLGAIVTFFVLLIDKFIFLPMVPEIAELPTVGNVNFLIGLSTVFQGGYTEEVLMRFGGVTLIVWLLSIIFKKKPAWIYVTAIFLIAIYFGIGHIGAFGPDPSAMLVFRTIVLNAMLGVATGFLYWKKGLEYAMIAHIMADIIIHSFFG